MPFKSSVHGHVLYVSWRGFSPADLIDVKASLGSLRAMYKREAVYLSRVPFSDHMFTTEEQAVLLEFLQAILPSCATIHHVVEGHGFVKSARRAIVTNMALATPRARDFYTHSTLAEAASVIEAMHHVDLSEIVARASTPPEPERAATAFREAARIAIGHRRR